MDLHQRYQQLIIKRTRAQAKLEQARSQLGHPHLDMMSAHDLAEQQFQVYQAYLSDLDQRIAELEDQLNNYQTTFNN